MIRSRAYLCLIAVLLTALAGLTGWAQKTSATFLADGLPARRQLVSVLSLTDLALWTEARYTRHPSMADLFSPFQDHPGAFDHFPAGSLMAPAGPRPETTMHIRRVAQP
ncbi:MAG: hypothetical protein IH613_13625 [Desulfuromonadales bacterium]|nr:hypothetical protein [Desulfuromonadales bacterium]